MRSWAIKSKIFLFILIVFYLCFTAYKLDVRVVPDEAWLSAPAYTFLTQGKMSIPAFKGDPDGRDRICLGSPLRVLLLAVAFKVFGFGVIQGRLLSLVFGLLTIVFTYYLAKYMFDQRIALFSSALVATDNYIFLTSRTIRPEIYLAAFLLVSFVVFVKALDKKSGVLFFISGLMLGLAVFMHINGVIAFAAFSLIYVSEYGLSGLRKRSYWHFAAGFAIILLSFIVYLLLLTYPDKINYLLGQYLIKSQMHESRLFPLFSSNWL
ncbi:MAG: glycosyltransferase family 39 protein, partial [Bacteroidales bacterium]